MNRLKSALANLDQGIDRLEKTLADRLTTMEQALRDTRADYEAASTKAKNAQIVSNRLDEVILQLETILAEKN
ncbi:MAG: hypothetical protein AB7G06_04540 [Bdellovibrionales bacterium]